jgi:rhamnulokinase
MNCVLAIDIGASSGRHILGFIDHGILKLKEIHRFNNKLSLKNERYCWDTEHLFHEIKKGITKCNEFSLIPKSIGIDTWGVDFVLLNESGELLGDAVSYRDRRTDGMMEEVFKVIPKAELYTKTGIQFQKFNTIYQLCALKKTNPELLEKTDTLLMMPDYFHYLLTGKKSNEYTDATTSQLVNAHTNDWDLDILNELGIKSDIFNAISSPKTILGGLRKELVDEFGFNARVILPPTHDTGSAFVAVPVEEDNCIFISSGTWSLIGVEIQKPICDEKSLKYNFTNEGGLDYKYRFLKNIMGLWMIQEVKKNYDNRYSFFELTRMAMDSGYFNSVVDVNDGRFMKPENMIAAIQKHCEENNQIIPTTPGEVAQCVFYSIAKSYADAICEIEDILDRTYRQINIVGGGIQNEYLNRLIACETEKPVHTGPMEATAIGNILSQLMALKDVKSTSHARQIIRDSFEIKKYEKDALSKR